MRTVLCVDDNGPLRDLLDLYLTRLGYDVETAADGVQALESLERKLPDVVITDLNMPRLDGAELTRRMRLDPETAAIPIIMISGENPAHAGAAPDRFLRKPMRMDAIADAVAGVLEPESVPA